MDGTHFTQRKLNKEVLHNPSWISHASMLMINETTICLQLYGGVYNLIQNGLPKIGIEVTMVDIFDLEALQKSLKSM